MRYARLHKTTHKFSDPPNLLRENLLADVTLRVSVGSWYGFIHKFDEDLCCGGGILHRCETPGVEVAKTVDVVFRVILKSTRLVLLQETAKGAARL
jgi:hypothetical protein